MATCHIFRKFPAYDLSSTRRNQQKIRVQSAGCRRNGSRKGLDFSPRNLEGTVVERTSVQSGKCGMNGSRKGLDFSPGNVEGMESEKD